MSKNLIKTTFILGTIAVASAGIASLLSKEENRKKVKSTANDLSKRANVLLRELEEDYNELDSNIKKYTKSSDYKHQVNEATQAGKEILKQMEVLKNSATHLLRAFKREAAKSID